MTHLFPKLRLFLWRETGGVGMLVAIEASGHVGRLLYLIVAVISEGPDDKDEEVMNGM